MDETDSTAAILSRTMRLIRLNAKGFAIWVIVLAAAGFVLRNALIGGALGIIAQYANTQKVLSELDLAPSGYRSPPVIPMLFLSIVSFLGCAIGLALLIVPGIILMVRWSISVPVLIAEEAGVIDALRGSWRATEGRFWPILGALAVPIVPIAVIILAMGLAAPAIGVRLAVGLASVATNGLMVVVWYIATAIYARPLGALQRLDEVFA